MGDAGDEEASETVADLPRFEADAEAVREADLRAAAAATAARDGVPRDGVPRLGNGKPRITTTAPWAMGAGRPAPPARQRRTAAPWAPPAPGKPGTSPTKQSAVGLGSMPTMGRSLPPHQCATTTTAPPPPPPQAFLDSCPGLSDRHSSLRVEAMTYGSLFGGVDTAVRRDGCPPCPVVVPVFQRTYCWTDEQVAGWWRDAFMGGTKEGDAKPKPAAERLAHGTGRCLFRRVMTEGDGGDGSGSSGSQSANHQSLLCLDGQQRSTTTQLALAAVRDAALGLGDDALVRRIENALWETGDDVLEWIQSAAKTLTNTGGDSGLTPDSSPYVEGARPPFRSRFVPSWVDRAPFLECIAAGAVHHVAGTPLTYSPATLSTFMGRAKLLLDAKAAELVDVHDRTRSIERLVAAVDAALVGTKLIYIEVKGDDVDLAQAFQWLQEKSLFAGSILWNPTPGVDFAACDLVRNALVSTTLGLSLREQEARYVAMWLDPLQRRVKNGGSPAAFDALLNAFLDAEDARREKWAKERGASERSAKGGAVAALKAASMRVSALAADGVPVGPRYVSATERDLGAMMGSDAVPEKFKKGAGPGSPMWVYCRFRSYVEEVALGVSGVDPGTRKAKKRGKPRNFDMTTSAPPPEEDEEEEEKVSGISDGDGLWGGVDGARDEGEDGGDAVPITDEVTRVVLARVVEFAEGNGHFDEQ